MVDKHQLSWFTQKMMKQCQVNSGWNGGCSKNVILVKQLWKEIICKWHCDENLPPNGAVRVQPCSNVCWRFQHYQMDYKTFISILLFNVRPGQDNCKKTLTPKFFLPETSQRDTSADWCKDTGGTGKGKDVFEIFLGGFFFWNTGWARAVVAFVFSISKVFFSPLPHTRLFMVSLQSGCVFSTPQFFASDVVTICQHSRENNVIKEETVQQSCCWSISWIAPYNENSILSSCKILHNTNSYAVNEMSLTQFKLIKFTSVCLINYPSGF